MGHAGRTLVVLVSLGITLVGWPGATSGQWLYYPTPDVPRLADGKPNLAAPAPRLPDGRPDFSGIWQSARRITIDDPKAYTRPWTVEMPQRITLDTELIDEICLENEKSSQRMRNS